jgi:hypothetical protein
MHIRDTIIRNHQLHLYFFKDKSTISMAAFQSLKLLSFSKEMLSEASSLNRPIILGMPQQLLAKG